MYFLGLLIKESRSVAACFLFLDGSASSLLAILKTFQLAVCAGRLWMLRVDRFAAHVALASTKNRHYSIAWLRPSFFLSLYCSQWKRRSRDSLETDKTSGRFWVFVSGRFCDRTEEREKLRRAEDLPPKTEGLAPLDKDYILSLLHIPNWDKDYILSSLYIPNWDKDYRLQFITYTKLG